MLAFLQPYQRDTVCKPEELRFSASEHLDIHCQRLPRLLNDCDIHVVRLCKGHIRLGSESMQDRDDIEFRGEFEMTAATHPAWPWCSRRWNNDWRLPSVIVLSVFYDKGVNFFLRT